MSHTCAARHFLGEQVAGLAAQLLGGHTWDIVAVPQTCAAGQFMRGQVARLAVQLLGGHVAVKAV